LNRFVLDCSVTAAWCIEDEANPSTDRLLDSLQHAWPERRELERGAQELARFRRQNDVPGLGERV
jgi:hypothetical protein